MGIDKGEIIMKKWFKAFAVMGACAFMLSTTGVASADEYEGYDEDGNYAVVAEGADGSTYEEIGEY